MSVPDHLLDLPTDRQKHDQGCCMNEPCCYCLGDVDCLVCGTAHNPGDDCVEVMEEDR